MSPEELSLCRQLVEQNNFLSLGVVDKLLKEIERLQIGFFNLQSQLIIEGHDEGCACVQAASVDCSCGARSGKVDKDFAFWVGP